MDLEAHSSQLKDLAETEQILVAGRGESDSKRTQFSALNAGHSHLLHSLDIAQRTELMRLRALSGLALV